MAFDQAIIVITIIFHNEKEVKAGIGFLRVAAYPTEYTT
jgi:hypothetical protein